MQKADFQEALLAVMESKEHWAWRAFTEGKVARDKLHIHLEQEYATYVRDFPIMVGWAYVQCPIAEVRRGLAENIFEEETGGLSGGRPHPELFLEYPRGLGMDLARFERVELLPNAANYRRYLDESVQACGWATATAIATLFIEGTKWDRGELDDGAPKRPEPPLSEHPLVKHYGLSLEHLTLTKVHRGVEGSHRAAAWHAILDFAPASDHMAILERMRGALAAWKRYRDDVAEACGLSPTASARQGPS